jgi:hypothetical protein
MTANYAKTDKKRLIAAVRTATRLDVTPSVPNSSPLELDSLIRLFGTSDLSDLELLGKVRIEGNGDVVIAVGPYAGEVLSGVDSLTDLDMENGDLDTSRKNHSPQVLTPQGVMKALGLEPRTYGLKDRIIAAPNQQQGNDLHPNSMPSNGLWPSKADLLRIAAAALRAAMTMP